MPMILRQSRRPRRRQQLQAPRCGCVAGDQIAPLPQRPPAKARTSSPRDRAGNRPTFESTEKRPPMPVWCASIGTPWAASKARRPLTLPIVSGSVRPKKRLGMRATRPAALPPPAAWQSPAPAFPLSARLGRDHETRGRKVQRCRNASRAFRGRDCRKSACAAAPLAGGHVARNVPARELGERLAAKARTAGAKKDQRARTLRQPGVCCLSLRDIDRIFRDAQHGQRLGLILRPHPRDGAARFGQVANEGWRGQSVGADSTCETALDGLHIREGRLRHRVKSCWNEKLSSSPLPVTAPEIGNNRLVWRRAKIAA